jgi:hypothetical protein
MKLHMISLFAIIVLSGPALAQEELRTGLDVIRKYEEVQTIETQKTVVRLVTTNKRGQTKERAVEQYTTSVGNGLYHSLIRFLSPADERGTSLLIHEYADREDDQWLYLADLKKVRRIATSDISDNFMGTEITYEDLRNQISEDLEDYEYELLGTEDVDGFPCYKVLAVPVNPDTKKGSAYSKRILWIRNDVFEIIKTTFYDHEGQLFKEYRGQDTRLVEGTDRYRTYIDYEKSDNYPIHVRLQFDRPCPNGTGYHDALRPADQRGRRANATGDDLNRQQGQKPEPGSHSNHKNQRAGRPLLADPVYRSGRRAGNGFSGH